MPATLKDVAHAAGVSNVTASRVLTGKPSAVPISEATRRRVLEAAARLDYRPNLLARGLRTQRSGTVAVLVEDITDPFLATLIPEVDTVLKERGYHLLLSHAALDAHSARTYDRLLGSWVDGLLVLGDRVLARDDEQEVLTHHRHVVAIARARTGTAIPSVNVDDAAGVRLALEHLWALGHRHIGFVGNRLAWDMEHRLETFLAAMAARGLPVPEDHVASAPHTVGGGYMAAGRLLRAGARPTALLCSADLLALGALCALQEAGVQVPRDLSVVGFDDIPLAAYATPPLTTVRQPAAALARTAATLLLDRIAAAAAPGQGDQPDAPGLLLVPELIVRRSTGPARAALKGGEIPASATPP